MALSSRFLPRARIDVKDEMFLSLFYRVLSRIPPATPPVQTVRTVALETSGRMEGLVGLTRWRDLGPKKSGGSQFLSFYSALLSNLSDDAAVAVIAHELAHAWLNEHLHPEESSEREREADELAQKWGFAKELNQLANETEPV